MMSSSAKDLATSLFKGLDLLTLLNAHRGGLGIYEIVDAMELPRSSLIRLLDSLAHYGLVARDVGKRYYVTAQFDAWKAPRTEDDAVAPFKALMREICDSIGEMVVFGRLEGRRVRHLHCEEPDRRVRVVPPIGREFRLETLGMGKLLLGVRPDLMPPSAGGELKEAVAAGIRDGFAWNRAESEEGIVAWATWLGAPTPVTPLLAITWPDFRFDEGAVDQVKSILRRHGYLQSR